MSPMNRLRPLLAAALVAPAFAVLAQSAGVSAERGWTRPTVPGQPAAGGYLVLRNAGAQADRLVAASSPAAQRVELHTMKMEGDVMRMREVSAIDLPAGQTVQLKPGGLHLMVFGLKSPLKAGDRLPLVLKLDKGGELRTELAVGATAPAAAAGHDHGPAGHKH